ncbi:DUF6344 domain-containing protein [Streptomyces sp. NPDC058417]|uniref:DUF6344 domain-containing protein n=1 Tax=unclassified Streptomyces TaxID=2593676 RepID=UPI00366449BF
MPEIRVKKLWTVLVTAFLALCTALGLVTTTAATASAQSEPTRNSSESATTATANESAVSPWAAWLNARSLPPTMKQRIRAEAHGSSPNCRHRALPDTDQADHLTDAAPADRTTDTTAPCATDTDAAARTAQLT